MERNHTSHELLAHFEPIDAVENGEPFSPSTPRRVRDARWVLKWATALAILTIAAATLLEFGYLLVAERTLNIAARAGAIEATLPRATYHSVLAAVKRRLAGYSQMPRQVQLTLLRNGQPIGKQLPAGDDVRFSVVVKAPASSAFPIWLTRLTPWRSAQLLSAHAERTAPSRQLQRSQL